MQNGLLFKVNADNVRLVVPKSDAVADSEAHT